MKPAGDVFEKVSDSGQPHIVVARARTAGLQSGQTARVSMNKLHACPLNQDWQSPITAGTIVEVRFCNILAIEVSQRDGQGNQSNLPHEVWLDKRITEAVKELGVAMSDSFRLENAEVSINGSVQIKATKETCLVFGDRRVMVINERNVTADERLIEDALAPQPKAIVA